MHSDTSIALNVEGPPSSALCLLYRTGLAATIGSRAGVEDGGSHPVLPSDISAEALQGQCFHLCACVPAALSKFKK